MCSALYKYIFFVLFTFALILVFSLFRKSLVTLQTIPTEMASTYYKTSVAIMRFSYSRGIYISCGRALSPAEEEIDSSPRGDDAKRCDAAGWLVWLFLTPHSDLTDLPCSAQQAPSKSVHVDTYNSPKTVCGVSRRRRNP